MAVTITQAALAVAIRAAADATSIPAAVTQVIGVHFPAAEAMILAYAPQAPDAIHDAAMVRLVGWLYDADPTDSRLSNPLEVSGTSNLLQQWRVIRAGAFGEVDSGDGPGPGPVTPGAGLPPLPSEGSHILIVNNGVLAWVAFPLPPS